MTFPLPFPEIKREYTRAERFLGPRLTQNDRDRVQMDARCNGWEEWYIDLESRMSRRDFSWYLAFIRDGHIEVSARAYDPYEDDDPFELD